MSVTRSDLFTLKQNMRTDVQIKQLRVSGVWRTRNTWSFLCC